MDGRFKRILPVLGAVLLAGALAAGVASAATGTSFKMVRSSGAVTNDCLEEASANVSVNSLGPVEVMKVTANDLPPNREFDLFVTQLPNGPFGVSWYQGDLETDANGHAEGRFVGRFSIETFAVAPGEGPAPVVHDSPIPDAPTNPQFGPVHTFHLGLWFNSPRAAKDAGCTGGELVRTPFNGVHNAGVQALSTRNFGNLNGPLRKVQP